MDLTTHYQRISRKRLRRRAGFSLVTSLLLMMLLATVSVGMLSLATITLRSSGNSAARAVAQANARMALQIALGNLQKHAGPDQRITASAELLNQSANSKWTGVWSTTRIGDPSLPMVAGHGRNRNDAAFHSDLRASDPQLANGAWRNQLLLAWLVSGKQADPSSALPPSVAIELVGPGTVGPAAADREKVSAPYVEIRKGDRPTGGYAWWVGDESTKARVDLEAAPAANSAPPGSRDILRLAGAGGPGLKNVAAPDGSKPYGGLASLETGARSNLISLPTLEIAAGDPRAGHGFHHLTTHSKGLLVDVVSGALKKDLTSFLEGPASAPPVNGIPDTGLAASAPILPSTNFRRSGPRFEHLRNWYDLRKQVQGTLSDARLDDPPSIATRSGITSDSHYNLSAPLPDISKASQAIQPIMTDFRVAFDFSHDPTRAAGRGIRVHLYPQVTLWNPYNLTLRGQTYYVGANLPQVNNLAIDGQRAVSMAETNGEMYPGVAPANTNGHMIYFTLAAIDLAPGEALVFSPDVAASGGRRIASNSAQYNPANIATNVLSAAIPAGTNNFHLLTNRRVPDEVNLANRPDYGFTGGVNQAFDNAPTMVLKRLKTGGGTVTLANLHSSSAETLQLIHFGHNGTRTCWWWYLFGNAKVAVNGGTGFERYEANPNRYPPRLWSVQTRQRWLDETDEQAAIGITHSGAAGAFFYNNPVIGNFNVRAQMVFRDPFSFYHGWTKYAPGGYMIPWSTPRLNDTRMSVPFRNGKANGSPFSAPRDLTGPFAMFEVPRSGLPLFSLACFQHAQLGYHSWHPTYIVGHSLAEPRADRASGVNKTFLAAGPEAWGTNMSRTNQRPGTWADLVQNLQSETLIHDISFAVNQQLWDRYFLSSIPHSGGSVRWNPNTEPLPNSNLRLIQPGLDSAASALLTGRNTLDHAAAFLGNYGAFNVNSASVEAWRAMFSSLNDIPRPSLAGGNVPDAFSRLLLPLTSDQASTRRSVGTWAGARSLSAAEIDRLAETTVALVRERGPFLSMADFVNRRLQSAGSNDTRDPSLCGPLQAAIERAGINTRLQNATAGDLTSTDAGGANKAADEGAMEPDWKAFYPFKNYGAPGYLTQADILQTLGHRLTVRGDTFLIRAYGDARDASGRVLARAWCEAVVQRLPEYIAPRPPAAASTATGNSPLEPAAIRSPSGYTQTPNTALIEVNRSYGRRFIIERFRWLNPSEV
jgi:type II secretory pathway pseudopilin PulG